MYEINLMGLVFSACHGVNPEEKINPQPFKVDVFVMLEGHIKSDDIESTVSYAKIAKTVKAEIEGESVELIETLAEKIAKKIIIAYPAKEVEITVHKPKAPISIPFEDICVKVKRKRSRAFISIGSNMGERENFIKFGIEKLGEQTHTKVIKTSSVIETEPYGNVIQGKFLNAALELETILDPKELLDFLHTIENEADRKRIEHWGPRTLDLDILLYDNELIQSEELTVPHPDMKNRLFVLEPLFEIAPNVIHPVYNKSISDLLKEIK